jgi:hypothetical protein
MISLLCPTRGRPFQLERMVHSVLATVANPIEILLYVDSDDLASAKCGVELCVSYIKIGPRIILSQTWNELAKHATGDILAQWNDDIIARSPGWDKLVEEAFAACPDKILMVHGNDGSDSGLPSSNGSFGVHPFVHRRWIETLGYFMPGIYSSDYGDAYVNFCADQLGRRRYLPFIIEHMHFWLGKASEDQTTRDRLARHDRDNVSQLWRESLPQRIEDVQKLRRAMNG